MEKINNYDHTELYTEIGYNVSFYRRRANLTQEQLAELIGISRSHLSAIEAPGVCRGFSIDVILDIASALHIEAYKLLKKHD